MSSFLATMIVLSYCVVILALGVAIGMALERRREKRR